MRPAKGFNLAAFGRRTSPPGEELRVYLWPDNVATWNAWLGVQTQWRAGMSGYTGLDYAGVVSYLRIVCRARGDQLAELLRGIQACEIGALRVWAEERSRE